MKIGLEPIGVWDSTQNHDSTHTHTYYKYEIKINFGAILILRSNKNHIMISASKLVGRVTCIENPNKKDRQQTFE